MTQLLQAKTSDIMDGINLIQALKHLGMLIRNDIDSYHKTWYEQAVSLARKVEIEEAVPRTAGRQTMRDDLPFSSSSEYYKRVITIPVIDHLNSNLKTRFDDSSVKAYYGISIVPTKMLSLVNETGKCSWKQKFKIFSDFYLSDLPNPLALDGELEV